jgi:hypothetical protein
MYTSPLCCDDPVLLLLVDGRAERPDKAVPVANQSPTVLVGRRDSIVVDRQEGPLDPLQIVPDTLARHSVWTVSRGSLQPARWTWAGGHEGC